MKSLSQYLHENIIHEDATIKSEKDFREAARAKFEEVFGDKLDEEKMKKTIDGFLEDNKDLVEKGEWGELIGMFNQSFAPDNANESLVNENNAPRKNTTAYDYNGNRVKIIDVFDNSSVDPEDAGDVDEFINQYDDSGAMKDELKFDDDLSDDLLNGKRIMVAVKDSHGHSAVYVWGPEGVDYNNK